MRKSAINVDLSKFLYSYVLKAEINILNTLVLPALFYAIYKKTFMKQFSSTSLEQFFLIHGAFCDPKNISLPNDNNRVLFEKIEHVFVMCILEQY